MLHANRLHDVLDPFCAHIHVLGDVASIEGLHAVECYNCGFDIPKF